MNQYIIAITDGSEMCRMSVYSFANPTSALAFMLRIMGQPPCLQWRTFSTECTIGEMVDNMKRLSTTAYLIDGDQLFECHEVGDGLVHWDELN